METGIDRLSIALAGVRAARAETYRADGLLRRAIRVAARQGVAPEHLAGAAGTSVATVKHIVGGRVASGAQDADSRPMNRADEATRRSAPERARASTRSSSSSTIPTR